MRAPLTRNPHCVCKSLHLLLLHANLYAGIVKLLLHAGMCLFLSLPLSLCLQMHVYD